MQVCAESIEPHKKQCSIHALVRVDDTGEWSATTNQKVPGYTGFQPLISAPVKRERLSTPWPNLSHPRSLFLMMLWWIKGMLYAVVVGNQSVYTLLIEIKNEYPQDYESTISFLGPFHTQSCKIYAIYKKWYSWHFGCRQSNSRGLSWSSFERKAL